MIKQNININRIDNLALLNGHGVHWSVFKKIMLYPRATATEVGIEADGVLYPYSEPDLKPVNFEFAIPHQWGDLTGIIGIDYKLLSRAGECLYGANSKLALQFNEKSIIIRATKLGEYTDQEAFVCKISI
jgi:hypothetical protein